ncbi:kinase-like domain-containing protein [Gigaspora rosea]|uniref:Kinase-like domain-containing protein n=1 Tax=Gigaspora rosea TaxID=44941 RepID=A0A397V3B5_9GLOM|nr:kinase-like domain-containing protein [Gigaspora rosea]
MEYAKFGCLRDNLNRILEMKWKDKLILLQCIISDLQIIHSHGLIHRDLHSGNILQNELNSAYIADLGLTINANIELKLGVYGVLPYIAPEVLNGKSYTKAFDIYSFGIIMWEILFGTPTPFKQNTAFQFQVISGLRPHIPEGTTSQYIDLMRKCWDGNPENRPSAENIYDSFIEWQDDENILLELSESTKKIPKEVKLKYDKTKYTSKLITRNSISQCQVSELIGLEVNEETNE